jgi:DNA-directed RNA polymerase specialized sigma24 family protein
MNSTVTRLDLMLYAWLAEPDNQKFERAFKKYHDEAFVGLVKYLARRSSSLELDFEQIAVDALLKFFSRVGRGRREASEAIVRSLPHVQGLELSPFHLRQARRWATDIGAFRERSMTFTLNQQDEADGREWKAEIHSLAEKIPPLQRQGCLVLDPLCTEGALAADAEVTGDAEDGQYDFAPMRAFAARLKSDAHAGATVELRYPGALRFVDGTWTVITVLPQLRVPTNGYLFDIAQSLYLDECKARNRQKRGGAGGSIAEPADSAADPADATAHPLARISLDEESAQQEPTDAGEWGGPAPIALSGAGAAADPESDRIGEEFCQKFYAYLHRPLDAAEEAYRLASLNGPAKAERKRLDSLSRKVERIIAVLSMRIEGQTQEAIAEALGVSRNQVKYIVEQIQEAYEQFAAAGARTWTRQPTAGAISHVQ